MKQKYSAGQEKGQENKIISNPIDLFSAEVNGKDQITRIQDWLTQNLEVESLVISSGEWDWVDLWTVITEMTAPLFLLLGNPPTKERDVEVSAFCTDPLTSLWQLFSSEHR